MKMLDDIVDGAVDDKVSLTTLLRKCLVVAGAIQNDKLKKWVLSELNGYTNGEQLPEYREIGINAVGQFVGSFGRSIQNQPLPAAMMDEEHQHWAREAHLVQPISSYEKMSADRNGKSDSLAIPWPAELVVLYQDTWFPDQGMILNRAHQVIPVSSMTGMVDKVRNKLLEFALELRSEIGTEDPTPQNPPHAIVERHVTQIIYGNVYGSSISGDVVQTVSHTVVEGDFHSLSKSLTEIGIPAPFHSSLEAALDTDKKAGYKGIGPNAEGWAKTTLKALGKSALKVTEVVAEKAIEVAIKKYMGQ